MHERAIVLLSGGQDSGTCLFWAKKQGYDVTALAFHYGQRHQVEIDCARKLADLVGAPFEVMNAEMIFGALADSDLIGKGSGFSTREDGLPSSFVPGRNILFLTVAGALAKKIGATRIVTGVCETDYSGYPDCREKFVVAMNRALGYGLDEPALVIDTPLMHMTKAQTWELAAELGQLHHIVELTHTCYNGTRTLRHDWGYGCGVCPACRLRAAGWAEYREGKK